MKKYIRQVRTHVWYYTIFLALELIQTILVGFFSYDHKLVMAIVIAFTGILTTYSCLHAYFAHKLTTKVVIEYVLMGVVGITISFFVFH